MSRPGETRLTKDELAELAHQLSVPVDCEKLVLDGVLAPRRGWFELLQPNLLPEHASRQVTHVKVSGGRTMIRFTRSHGRAKALQRKQSS